MRNSEPSECDFLKIIYPIHQFDQYCYSQLIWAFILNMAAILVLSDNSISFRLNFQSQDQAQNNLPVCHGEQ